MKNLLIITLFTLIYFTSFSQTSTWDGEASTSNWEDNKNWSGDVLPCNACDVVINDSVAVQSLQKVQSITLTTSTPIAVLQIQPSGEIQIASPGNSIQIEPTARLRNSGQIKIASTGARGINLASNSYFNNNGLIEIDNCTDVGIHLTTASTFDNLGDILIQNCLINGIKIINGISAQFSNLFGGTIQLSSINGEAFYNQGFAKNLGDITFSNIGDIGIYNLATLVNESTGSIEINDSVKEGVYTTGSFTNFGELLISDSIEDGILSENIFNNTGEITITDALKNGLRVNLNVFTNSASGDIKIFNAQDNGIFIDANATNFRNLNTATIEIDSTVNDGIRIEAEFNNEAEISIKKSNRHGIYNFNNADSLINKGNIMIRNTLYSGVNNGGNTSRIHNYPSGTFDTKHNETGLNNNGFFLNDGIVQIDSSTGNNAFRNTFQFINNGELIISNSFYIAAFNSDNISNAGMVSFSYNPIGYKSTSAASLINQISGIIKIDSSRDYGMWSYSPIINYGDLEITRSDAIGLYNTSDLNNYGTIHITNCSSCIYNASGSFKNKPTGIINIDSAIFSGVQNSVYFANEGVINIENCSNVGIRNEFNADSLINKGTIKIAGGQTGLLHSASSFVFLNEGNLNLDSLDGNGLSLSNRTINSGEIKSTRCGIGLNLNSNIDTVFNSGKIILNNNVNGISITNSKALINKPCGNFSNSNNWSISNTSEFINQGYFKETGPALSFSTGTFNNEGILDDSLGQIMQLANFTNSGLISQKLYDDLSVGIKELPIFLAGSSPAHTLSSNWWAEYTKNTVIGNFSEADYSFTPNIAALAADTLWYEATSISIGCKLQIPVVRVEGGCSSGTYLLPVNFTAAISDDWHVPGNWSNNLVPEPCSRVVIQNTKKCKIYSGRKARAFSISSVTGSVLDVQSGAVLVVQPN